MRFSLLLLRLSSSSDISPSLLCPAPMGSSKSWGESDLQRWAATLGWGAAAPSCFLNVGDT